MQKYIGQRIKRIIEDPKLITGSGKYVNDYEFPGTLYLAIYRSPVAHARLKKTDVSDALKQPNVIDIIIGLTYKVANRPKNFPMAVDELLYVGQPIAAVLATDPYSAYDALDYIQIDYDSLDVVVDPEKALEDKVKAVENESNIAYRKTYLAGNPEEALKNSDVIIEDKLTISRVYPAPMEPRGVYVVYQEGRLVIYASTQSPHYMRRYLMETFGNVVNDIRVIQADVGGAFGSKLFPYPEDYISVFASIKHKRPVKWFATRREDIMSMYHSRAQIHKFKVGANKDGKVNVIIDDLILDLGAGSHGFYLADITATLITGPYDVRNAKVEVYGVHTNKVPLDQYRGAGRPEAAFFYERVMDLLANELKEDPIELRKKNLITKLPYTNPFGLRYDSGDYLGLLEKAKHYYREFERKAEELRKQGHKAAAGFSFYVEQNNFGPWESASVRLKGDGKVLVMIGAAPHGQGDATAIAQIVADELGVALEDVQVVWGDTDIIGEGFGTYGSRTLTLAGNAALIASKRLIENLKRYTASVMNADVEEIEYSNGTFKNKRSGQTLTLRQLAETAMSLGASWPYRAEPLFEASAYYGMDNYTFPYGSHVALVEVDETGKVKVLDYIAIDDIGVVVNPMLAEGQVRGGVIQGYGEALLEEIIYDENGNLLTPTLADYLIPAAPDSFNIKWEYIEKGFSQAPLPAKGIGEGAPIGSMPALISAVGRATGKKITRIPVRLEDLI